MAKRLLENGGDDALLKAKQRKEGKTETKTKEEKVEGKSEAKEEEKEEKNEEVKEEIKEEVKEELQDTKEEEVDAILKEVEEGDTPKGTRRKRSSGRQEEEPLPEVEAADTETEYEEPDLSGFPPKLFIEECSYDKLNGMYRIMAKPSRGRPCYCKTANKNVFLYWHSSKRWHVGFELSAKKCTASIPDIGDLALPTEPYPNDWKVIEKHHDKAEGDGVKKDKVKCVSMRVIDGSVLNDSHQKDVIQPLELSSNAREEVLPESKASPSTPRKPNKTNNRPLPKKRNAVAYDEEAALVANAQQSDSEDEPKAKATPSQHSQLSDSNETASGSDSEESSSSESASEDTRKASEAEDTHFQALSQKAQSIVSKLNAMSKDQAAAKVKHLFATMRSKTKKGMPLAAPNGFSPSDMEHIAKWCFRHLGLTDLDVSPSITMSSAGPRTPDEPQPQTPPEDTSKRTEAQTLLPHHTHQPTKSVLRHPADRNKRKRSIQYAPDGDLKTEVTIPSYKSLGEGLWFQCPGSLVNCDHCNRLVPQAMGSLQGAPARSQFAQNLFLCQECSARAQ